MVSSLGGLHPSWNIRRTSDTLRIVVNAFEKTMGKRKYNYGFADIPRQGPLSVLEAAFLEEKRHQGIPDTQIAKMLGCTVEALKRGLVVDNGFASSRPREDAAKAEEKSQWLVERDERNRIARKMSTWRADAPNPLAKEAAFPPGINPSTSNGDSSVKKSRR